ncbi:MAG: hypothetical protein K2I43_00210 [Alistipes sp.]|nr:hypothetical protein [Alistipes sp.]
MKTTKLEPLLEKPTKTLMERWLSVYKANDCLAQADELQRRLADSFTDDYAGILSVVVFLNQIYSTNLYLNDVYRMAGHIYNRRDAVRPLIDAGSPEAVAMIACGHGIARKGCRESVLYSFASKFCNFLNPDCYPIFDSHVEQMLKAYNRKYGFRADGRGNLRDYAVFRDCVRSFIGFFGLECTFWESDKFLWTYYDSLKTDNER